MTEGGATAVARWGSALCTQASIESPQLRRWAKELSPAWDVAGADDAPLHRKVWEWTYIAEVLDQRELLSEGRAGLGFGVGRDPLAAAFAARGCRVTATDAPSELAGAAGWIDTGQYGGSVSHLNEHGLCEPAAFGSRVAWRTVDMNDIPLDLAGYDFTWSACAFEHLGSIDLSLAFLVDQMACLRPGGTAVHTTEFNVYSDGPTIERGPTVLLRGRDLGWVAAQLSVMPGVHISLDLHLGDGDADRWVDVQPWRGPHLKVRYGDHVTTSLAVVIDTTSGFDPALVRARRFRARKLLARRAPRVVAPFDDALPRVQRARARLTRG